MSEHERVVIRKLPSGVPGFDDVLGGGIPEYSFNMIAGAPGTGKTTITEQIMFANATPERPALHFTVLGEPQLKMLRYQQQFSFFDLSRVGKDVRFLNLSDEVLQRNFDAVFDRMVNEVEKANPSIVVVDSFRTVIRSSESPGGSDLDLQHFVQRLALRLISWEATTFLLGEYGESESRGPVFTVADGVFWLSNEIERNATVRKLRVTKIRGQAPLSGMHTMRITGAGVEVFPRQPQRPDAGKRRNFTTRMSTGVAELDRMMSGGVPAGDSILISGPTGAGKTIIATQFIAAGVNAGECAVIAVFEEHPETYIARAQSLGFDVRDMMDRGKLDIMYLRPLDLSVDETLREIEDRVRRIGATRVVIDSLTGFEIALAPSFRQDFRESFYRLIQALTELNITVLSTLETTEGTDYLRFSPYNISFLSDDIVAMRYIELEGQLRTVLGVIKMRGSEHSRELRLAEITSHGLEIREALTGYRGIITGVPEPLSKLGTPAEPVDLTSAESAVLETLLRLGESSPEAIGDQSGLTLEEVARALDQLVAGHFVNAVESAGHMVYRAATRSLR